MGTMNSEWQRPPDRPLFTPLAETTCAPALRCLRWRSRYRSGSRRRGRTSFTRRARARVKCTRKILPAALKRTKRVHPAPSRELHRWLSRCHLSGHHRCGDARCWGWRTQAAEGCCFQRHPGHRPRRRRAGLWPSKARRTRFAGGGCGRRSSRRGRTTPPSDRASAPRSASTSVTLLPPPRGRQARSRMRWPRIARSVRRSSSRTRTARSSSLTGAPCSTGAPRPSRAARSSPRRTRRPREAAGYACRIDRHRHPSRLRPRPRRTGRGGR